MSLEFEKLSTHNWSAPGVPSQRSRVQEEHESQQEGHVQIMYSKDQVYQEDAEFSLEELRAQRYYKSLSDKASHLKKLKQDLQCQIEDKKRLIQQRNITSEKPQEVVHEEASSSFQRSAGSCESDAAVGKSAQFTVCSEQEEDRVVSSSVRREDDINHRGSNAKLQKTAKPFTVFDENTLTNKTSSSANRNSLKLPSLSLKAPRSKAESISDKDASISRSEEVIIKGHWNKTLCRSPDDTCEFSHAAQLASTPFGGVQRPEASESRLTENLSRTAPESTAAPSPCATAEENKLSPILEISQEWGGSSFANSMKQVKEPEIRRAADTPEEVWR
ncbi:mitotic checkpoint serine/threonine-protein kinase BUB1 beta-like [Carassius carassius]|uniref:mitotic checkpoint serine/threonine-protein kinase BUB1 beta-like n=1 Tax=Carassius carassius TaxID=217509 RepID=UPI0028684D7A|nr:mitotic checkpoint serine/threonine-protein kinase BUB1 beta-like [Carassius carassius]